LFRDSINQLALGVAQNGSGSIVVDSVRRRSCDATIYREHLLLYRAAHRHVQERQERQRHAWLVDFTSSMSQRTWHVLAVLAVRHFHTTDLALSLAPLDNGGIRWRG
jgi:hypothetical protein